MKRFAAVAFCIVQGISAFGQSGEPGEQVVSATATLVQIDVTGKDPKYFYHPMLPQAVCYVENSNVALFVYLDAWTARCLRERRISQSTTSIAKLEYGTRKFNAPEATKPEATGYRFPKAYIDDWDYDTQFQPLNEDIVIDRLPYVGTDARGNRQTSFHYRIRARKAYPSLGWHYVEISVPPAPGYQPVTASRAQTLAKKIDDQGRASWVEDRSVPLHCDFKFWTQINGQEVSFVGAEFMPQHCDQR